MSWGEIDRDQCEFEPARVHARKQQEILDQTGKPVGLVDERGDFVTLRWREMLMREEFLKRLTAKGVTVERAEWDAGRRYVDRILGDRIARRAFGDSTWKRRDVPDDVQLMKAIELLRRGRTTAELLALAGPPVAPARRN